MTAVTAAAAFNLDETFFVADDYAQSEREDGLAPRDRWDRRLPSPLLYLGAGLAGCVTLFTTSMGVLDGWDGRYSTLVLMFCGALTLVYALGFLLTIPLVRWCAPLASPLARVALVAAASVPTSCLLSIVFGALIASTL